MCNHARASKYFTESISPKVHFTSFPCENYDKFQNGECFDCKSGNYCGKMGYYSDQSKGRGSYYLLTQPEKPFHGRIFIDKKRLFIDLKWKNDLLIFFRKPISSQSYIL